MENNQVKDVVEEFREFHIRGYKARKLIRKFAITGMKTAQGRKIPINKFRLPPDWDHHDDWDAASKYAGKVLIMLNHDIHHPVDNNKDRIWFGAELATCEANYLFYITRFKEQTESVVWC